MQEFNPEQLLQFSIQGEQSWPLFTKYPEEQIEHVTLSEHVKQLFGQVIALHDPSMSKKF